MPSWSKQPAPAAITAQSANASTGMLPAIQPHRVVGPYHQNADGSRYGGTTLATSNQGVYAALFKCGGSTSCTSDKPTLVKTWDSQQANIELAQRLYNGQSFQLNAGQSLSPGDYYLAILPVGASNDFGGFYNAGSAIAPIMDSVVNYASSSPTFTVEADGKMSVGNDTFNVLLDVSYLSLSPTIQNSPTLACSRSIEDGSIDPLMIDFSGQGINLSSQAAGIDFNMMGLAGSERVSWPLNPQNMFLVHDRTGYGEISGANFFGNFTVGPDGKIAKDGFEALAKYDSNHDGLIDSRDAIFDDLRVWSDANRDGKVQRADLRTLRQMGVESIELKAIRINEVDAYGNQTTLRAVVHMRGGGFKMINDVWFKPAPLK